MDRSTFWACFITVTSVTALLLPFGVQDAQHKACAESFERGQSRIDCILELGYPNRD